MKRLASRAAAALALGALAAASAAPAADEPFPPKGRYNNSVHRYFPDLDARLNAVRYGRWRALEIAWITGVDRTLDRRFSSYLLALISDPPRFAPEADRVAPRFAREAPPVFRALRWGQAFEQQVIDILASPDANPRSSRDRIERSYELYRREVWSLSEPGETRQLQSVFEAAPVSARILAAGTRLFAAASEDLAASDFGEQRWRVRRTVESFDRSYAEEKPVAVDVYKETAAVMAARHPHAAAALDRLARFHAEVFGALLGAGEELAARRERAARLREVALRYGIPSSPIDAR
jgi:hypothetical protein